ncbi:MAG TPA: ribonuclease P protein component [Candidatus Paceibacterota bacterium]|nr:ribonuclease P protein component [Candidatus Paceibacterota bacterium]HPT18003.1 ribonuclease P protein component [Candidatus Paceibacterota bacterium]
MLPKKNRADKRTIDNIFKEGRFLSSGILSLKYITNNTIEKKISFITPKNISKKAVDRNLLRRRGYSILEKYLDRFPRGFCGAFIFGSKSMAIFGKKRNKKERQDSIAQIDKEILVILNKLRI